MKEWCSLIAAVPVTSPLTAGGAPAPETASGFVPPVL